MKQPREKREGISSATITQTLLVMLGCSLFAAMAAYAADPTSWHDPSWWYDPGTGSLPAVMNEEVVTNGGVVTTNYITNQYAIVVQGQLKQFTARAVDELNAYLPNGAGTNLNTMVSNWAQDYATNSYTNSSNPYAPYNPRDFTAMNVGQLKQVGKMVWSQLVAEGYTNALPSWLAGTNVGDYNAATVGQLKTVFNFDLAGYQNTITNLTITLNVDGSATLNWVLPPGSSGPITIAGISVSGSVEVLGQVSPGSTSDTISAADLADLPFLSASNASLNLPVSLLAVAVAVPPPPAPTAVTGTLDSSGNMILTWQDSGAVNGYVLDRETVSTGSWTYGYRSVATGTYQDTAANRNNNNEGYVYQVRATSPTATSTPSSAFPSSSYAIIDLGANVTPIKITDSGYVLSGGSNYTCFHLGQTYTLTPSSSSNEIQASDINESGTIIGQETSTMTLPSSFVTFAATGLQIWSYNGTTFQPSGAPSYGNAYSGGMLYVSSGNYWEDFNTWESFSFAWNFFLNSSLGSMQWKLNRGNFIDSQGDKWSTACDQLVSSNNSPLQGQPIFDDFKNGTELGTISSNNYGGVNGEQYLVQMVNGSGQSVINIINYGQNTLQSPTGTVTTVFDNGTGSETPLNFTPTGMNSDGAVVGVNTTNQGIWWSAQYGVQNLGVGGINRINAAKTTLPLAAGQTGPPATLYAYQGVGGPELVQMTPTINLATATFQAIGVNDLAPPGCGWNSFVTTSINNDGVIVGTASYTGTNTAIAQGRHGVMHLPVTIVPDAGQSGTTGDLVPSIRGTGGQKHYVSPKQASSFVVLKANISEIADANFSTYFEWDTINPDGSSSSAGQAVGGSPDKWEVKRDTPGQYIVRLKTIADHKEVLRINVWIVWASGAITASPLPTASLSHISGFSTIDGTVSAGAFASLDSYYTFKFTIQPATITDKTQDIPDLTGPKDPAGDSQLGGQSPYSTNPLSGGAIDRWDVSRRVKYHFLNPNLIPYGKMTAGYGSIYQGEPQADLITIPFPSSNIIGNDDSSVGDEDNDPYDASTGSLLGHSIGSITSLDKPNSGLADAGGASGYSFEEDDLFQEFARLEINTTWYVVSDPVPWKLIMKLNYTSVQWTDNGTTTGTGN